MRISERNCLPLRWSACVIAVAILLFIMLSKEEHALAIDPPHNGQNAPAITMTCTSCHYDTSNIPIWATDPTTTDRTFYNNMCTSCHNPGTLPGEYTVKTHASSNFTGKYQPWTIECRDCHNPHIQDQVSRYPTDPTVNLLTSTVSATCVQLPWGTDMTISVNGDLGGTDNWVDYVFVPNTAYSTRMYRIKANTPNTITTWGAINCTYVKFGKPYGIRNGKMIYGNIPTPNSGLATVKYFTKDSSKPNSYASSTNPGNVTGICQVCHTQTKSFNRTNVTGRSRKESVIRRSSRPAHRMGSDLTS